MHCQCDGGIAKCLKASKSSQRVDIPNSKPKAWKIGFQQNGIAINFSRCRSWKTVVTITLHELQHSIEPRRKPSYFALYYVNRILIWFMKIPIKLGNLIPYTTQPRFFFVGQLVSPSCLVVTTRIIAFALLANYYLSLLPLLRSLIRSIPFRHWQTISGKHFMLPSATNWLKNHTNTFDNDESQR